MREGSTSNSGGFTWRSFAVFIGFMAIALFLLLSEHRIHVLGWLPFLLLAACPFMHLFMHHGHGGGGHGSHQHGSRPGPEASQAEGEI